MKAERQPRRPRPWQGGATLREVAEQAGVSTATASRALTRPERVSERTRATVRQAAAMLAYIPNVAAQSLSSAQSPLIGAVVTDLNHPSTLRGVAAFERAVRAAGCSVLLALLETGEPLVESALRLHAQGAGRIVIFGPTVPASPDGQWTFVDGGRRAGTWLALRYLAQLGHRHIGLVDDGDLVIEVAARLPEDLADVRLDAFHCEARSPAEAASTVLQQWQARAQKPTALVCSGDETAAHALRACTLDGVRVPDDLSIVGQGDTELGRWTQPALTTIRVGAETAALQAAAAMLSATALPAVHVPGVHIVLRASCAAPRR